MELNKKLIVFLVLFQFCEFLFSQSAPYAYLVSFTDKSGSPYSVSNPVEFLSQRAIDRRIKHGINIDVSDLPVNSNYIYAVDTIAGVQVVCKSKWFNNITVILNDSAKLPIIQALPFVNSIVRNKSKLNGPKIHKILNDELRNIYFTPDTSAIYGFAANQIKMMNGQFLHERGFTGNAMRIAVMDVGFNNSNVLNAFNHLRTTGKIIDGPDFVNRDNNVYDGGPYHGTLVLSCMASYLPGTFTGTAPDATYLLMITENDTSEYPVEEDFWIAGAEWADSAGADVFNTSLGYTQFDDASLNHTYADMDGNSTRITRGVDMSAKKGILSVNSAGNSGASAWNYISAPADADSNLTVGAVGPDRVSAFFSSRGPSYDLRVKPNVSTQGYRSYLIWPDASIAQGNGTSFSSPIMAGMAACLWEAFPDKTNMEIIRAIEKSASNYYYPNDSIGYGIPDMAKAWRMLNNSYNANGINLLIFDNPFIDKINMEFYSETDLTIELKLFDVQGKKITEEAIMASGKKHINYSLDLNGTLLRAGVYILKMNTQKGSTTIRLVKQ